MSGNTQAGECHTLAEQHRYLYQCGNLKSRKIIGPAELHNAVGHVLSLCALDLQLSLPLFSKHLLPPADKKIERVHFLPSVIRRTATGTFSDPAVHFLPLSEEQLQVL